MAIVLDAFSRRIVGWSLGESLERDLATIAFGRALETRPGAIRHADRNSQYDSQQHRESLDEAGLILTTDRASLAGVDVDLERRAAVSSR